MSEADTIDTSGQIDAVQRSVTAERGEGTAVDTVVTLRQSYATGVEDLWEACTTADRLARWFAPVSGELQLGGRFQVEGNAGGTIETCDPPHGFTATWEFGGETSNIEVRVEPDGDDRSALVLTHSAAVDPGRFGMYGAGAVGVGWDLALLGLATHMATGSAKPAEMTEWGESDDAKAFMTASSTRWGDASIAAGVPEDEARAAEARTTAFYTELRCPSSGARCWQAPVACVVDAAAVTAWACRGRGLLVATRTPQNRPVAHRPTSTGPKVGLSTPNRPVDSQPRSTGRKPRVADGFCPVDSQPRSTGRKRNPLPHPAMPLRRRSRRPRSPAPATPSQRTLIPPPKGATDQAPELQLPQRGQHSAGLVLSRSQLADRTPPLLHGLQHGRELGLQLRRRGRRRHGDRATGGVGEEVEHVLDAEHRRRAALDQPVRARGLRAGDPAGYRADGPAQLGGEVRGGQRAGALRRLRPRS